jgi:hypothetical protein
MMKEGEGPAWKQRCAFGSRGEHAVASWHARWNVPWACCRGPPGVMILIIMTGRSTVGISDKSVKPGVLLLALASSISILSF